MRCLSLRLSGTSGAGDEAASVAGRIRHNGRFVMLVPHELDPKVLKGDIPLPLPRPTEQQISDFKAEQAKADAKDHKAAQGAPAAAKNKAVKTEAASDADDDKSKKRKLKHKG